MLTSINQSKILMQIYEQWNEQQFDVVEKETKLRNIFGHKILIYHD